MYDNSNYSTYQDSQPIVKGVEVEDREDNSRWEIDTGATIDSFYHELLGETEQGGLWVLDKTLKRWMNERGASWVKSEFKSRIDKITFLSKLDDEFIRDSLCELGKSVSDMLFSYYDEFEIEPSPSNLKSLANMIIEKVEITYRSAKDGGMRAYRISAKGGHLMQSSPYPSPYPYLQPNGFNQPPMPSDGHNGGVM